jgi:hypothetical protein
MKQPPEILLDVVYRATFRDKTNPGWRSNIDIRHALESAHRFIADEKMARFMAELATEAFLKADNPLALKIADSLRVQARLPYPAIWVEYPLREYQYQLIFALCEIQNIEIVIINKGEPPTFEEELAQDVIEIITVFSAKTKKLLSDLKEGSEKPDLLTVLSATGTFLQEQLRKQDAPGS